MRIHLACYRLFENPRGFDDYERFPDGDAVFDDVADAIAYMNDKCDCSNGTELYVFDVWVQQ